MTSVWYVGPAHERTLSDADWDAALGSGSYPEKTWNYKNGWSIDEDEFTTDQLNYLHNLNDFTTGNPDGPRVLPSPPPSPFEDYKAGNAYVFYAEILKYYQLIIDIINHLPTGAATELSTDLSPQLGGNLDLNGFKVGAAVAADLAALHAATAIGIQVFQGADAAAIRGIIGAGTSSLGLGTIAGSAKAGNWFPNIADIQDAGAFGKALVALTDLASFKTAVGNLGSNNWLKFNSGTSTWDANPNNGKPSVYVGGVAPTNAPTDLQNGDLWFPTAGDGPSLGAVLTALQAISATANRIPYFSADSVAGLLTLSTDVLLAANSDTTISSQKATKGYIDAALAALVTSLGTLTENPQSGTNYTLAASDNTKIITMSNAAANTITIPLNSAVAIPIGFSCEAVMFGAGQTTWVKGDSSITVRVAGGKTKFTTQYSPVSFFKRGTNDWLIVGDLTT